MRKLILLMALLLFAGGVNASPIADNGGGGDQWTGVYRDRPPREPRHPRPHRPHDADFGKRVTLGVAFGIGPGWLNPRTDSVTRAGIVNTMRYGIPLDINFTTKNNYYFTTGVFFSHSGGKLRFVDVIENVGIGEVVRKYNAIYLSLPTGIKLKTPSMKGVVVAAQFGFLHSFRLTAKASDTYETSERKVTTDKYMYTKQTAWFREAGFIGLGLEYVIKDDFRVYFYATYDHTFVNFFGKKAEPNLLSGKAMRATAGNVEFMVGICF